MTADELVALSTSRRQEMIALSATLPDNGWRRVFGGQVLAQALVAAERTVAGRDPHSLHAYFLLGGDPKEPILYEVERLRDGRSFTTRRVVARQKSAAIFVMTVSFHEQEAGSSTPLRRPRRRRPKRAPTPTRSRRAWRGRLASA